MASSDSVKEEQVSFELPAPFGWKKKVLLSIFSLVLFIFLCFSLSALFWRKFNSLIICGYILWFHYLASIASEFVVVFFPILLEISMVEIVIQQSDVVSARVCGFVLVFVLTYELLLFHINS